MLWTFELYGPVTGYFPRHPSEFRPAAEREGAMNAARAVLEADPENLAAWSELALAHFEQGPEHYLQGLEALERARDLGALDDRLFLYAGMMYEATGLLDYARPEYSRFLRHHPDDIEARLRLANIHYRLGDLDKAIDEYKTVLTASPSDAVVALNLAIAYRDRQRWQEGAAVLAPWTSEGKPLPEGAHKVLGDLALGSGDPSAALAHYHAAFAQDRESPGLAEGMALAYEQMGELTQAQDQWKRILEGDRKHRQAREKLRVLQRKIKAAERAQKK